MNTAECAKFWDKKPMISNKWLFKVGNLGVFIHFDTANENHLDECKNKYCTYPQLMGLLEIARPYYSKYFSV